MPRPVVICIGSDKITGDRLGPLVGDFLTEIYNVDAFVYGKSGKNVNGINFAHYQSHIASCHSDSIIVAVDSCLGQRPDVGTIKLTNKGVRAGGALGRQNERIGDLGILGIVGEYGKDNFNILKNIDKTFVQDLAFTIAAKLIKILQDIKDSATFTQLVKNSNLSYGVIS